MTVSELIERLKQFHPDLPVYKNRLAVDGETQQTMWSELVEVESSEITRERLIDDHIANIESVKLGITYEAVVF